MPHPKITAVDRLDRPESSASALGYRMPAEFEPLSGVWLSPPKNPETWPGCLDKAQRQFADWVDLLRRAVPVSTTDELEIPTNDAWVRDYGPIFVVHDDSIARGRKHDLPPLACHDFHFNTWGGKYEVRDLDDVVPQHIAHQLGLPIWIHDFVLEGGSIDVNGQGTVMTTQQCLLNPNRNLTPAPGFSPGFAPESSPEFTPGPSSAPGSAPGRPPDLARTRIEAKLHETLGTRHVIWLPGGIQGDDTDGHIDDVARFVSADTVVVVSALPGHPDHAITQRNVNALRAATDQDGRELRVVELPAPEPVYYDYPTGREPTPASYANFLIANGHVFVPVFGQRADEVALEVLASVMPGYRVQPIPAQCLVAGLGALHCLSQQQPQTLH